MSKKRTDNVAQDQQIPALTYRETKEALLMAAKTLKLRKGGRPVHLWGPPGVGKSACCRDVAGVIGLKLIDLRMSLLNPVDLRGVPVAKDGVTSWWAPAFLPRDPGHLILFDELNAAPPSVQAAAYQLVLDGRVGEYVLPDECYIVACGNRESDMAVTYTMPSALANRFTHVELVPDLKNWTAWAIDYGIDGRVISFLRYAETNSALGGKLFNFDPKRHKRAFCTPRSWHTVSDFLAAAKGNLGSCRSLVEGSVGLGAAAEFAEFCEVVDQLPDVRQVIVEGKLDVPMPANADARYAFSGALVGCLRERKARKDVVSGLTNLLRYCVAQMKDCGEFAMFCLLDAMNIPIIQKEKYAISADTSAFEEFEKQFQINQIVAEMM